RGTAVSIRRLLSVELHEEVQVCWPPVGNHRGVEDRPTPRWWVCSVLASNLPRRLAKVTATISLGLPSSSTRLALVLGPVPYAVLRPTAHALGRLCSSRSCRGRRRRIPARTRVAILRQCPRPDPGATTTRTKTPSPSPARRPAGSTSCRLERSCGGCAS